jgi:predicted transcriptional regulator of viral defense system
MFFLEEDMQRLTHSVRKASPPGGIFDQTLVTNLFPDITEGARVALVHRAVKKGEVLRIRNGVYVLDKEWLNGPPADPMSLVPLIYSPAYVSFETALRHHGLIPEHVAMISCGTNRRGKTFTTPVGVFEFVSIPCKPLMTGVELDHINGIPFPVASPFRAIADLIYERRQVSWEKDGIRYLNDSMRIEWEDLLKQDRSIIPEIITAYRSPRVRDYLAGLQQTLEPA